MEAASLRVATQEDLPLLVGLDYALNKHEHIELQREEKITKAVLDQECFVIQLGKQAVGFVIFDYRFFGQGWIDLVIVEERYRGKGIGNQVFNIICRQCTASKVFTSTNKSNTRMQNALAKAGFTFAGELTGLDYGDPELFFYKERRDDHVENKTST